MPGGLNHLVQRNAGGAQWTWKKVTVVVDSGAAENVMPRRLFPEPRIRATDQEESTSRTTGSKSRSSQQPGNLYARARGRLQT